MKNPILVLAEKPRARDEFEDVSLLFEEGYNRVLADRKSVV